MGEAVAGDVKVEDHRQGRSSRAASAAKEELEEARGGIEGSGAAIHLFIIFLGKRRP